MRFFKRKDDYSAEGVEYEDGFDAAVELLDEEIHQRLHLGFNLIPAKKQGRQRGYLEAMAVVSDVFDLYYHREVSAREFTNKTNAFWTATQSWNESNGSISKEWNSLGN